MICRRSWLQHGHRAPSHVPLRPPRPGTHWNPSLLQETNSIEDGLQVQGNYKANVSTSLENSDILVILKTPWTLFEMGLL